MYFSALKHNTENTFSFILEAASSFVRIPHSLGDWPTFVVVQVMTPDGYIFEAEGMEQNILRL